MYIITTNLFCFFYFSKCYCSLPLIQAQLKRERLSYNFNNKYCEVICNDLKK